MKYEWHGDTAAVRLEIGEDINECLAALCKKEKIEAGYITGIGALKKAAVGVYDLQKNAYNERIYEEFCELTSLVGNASVMNGEAYIHLHATLARGDTSIVGGHMKSGIVGATAEIFVRRLDGMIDRFHCDESGLNLFKI